MSAREKVCRNCKRIVVGDVCDNCGSTSFAPAYQGLFILLDPEKSSIAELLNAKKQGHYAVKIG